MVTRLVSRISRGDRPLGAIADALTELAATVDADRVVVAVDDLRLGRQVFTSARAPLGTEPVGLFGGPGIWTDPADRIHPDEAELVTAGVGVAVHALPHDVPALRPAPGGAGDADLAGAVARARDHGWAFTLTLVRFDDADASPARIAALQSALRPGDAAARGASAGTVTVLLPAARDDEVAAILAAAVREAGLPRCAFGLARCPADAGEATRLLALARRRLDDAIAARDPSNRAG